MARHIKKLHDPQKVHSDLAFPPGAKCNGCGRRPLIRAITMAPLDEARRRMPELEALMVAQPNAVLSRLVQINEHPGGIANPKPYLRLGIAYACQSCAPAMEKQLAKAPSWMIVEINRGPNQPKIISS